MNEEEAWALLNEYNKDPFHLEHGEIVGKTMRYFAEKLGYGDEADFWEVVGILHDLDFEQYPDQHCIKSQEIMRERGIDQRSFMQRPAMDMRLPWIFSRSMRWRKYCMRWMN